MTAHTDLATTIVELAAGNRSPDTDGIAIPLTTEAEEASRQEHVTIEYWGLAIPEGLYGRYGDKRSSKEGFGAPGRATGNNTYKAVRVISEKYNMYYAVWCTHESEFYDLRVSDHLLFTTET